MSPEATAYFAELAERALAGARAAPRYVKAMPMVGRGWRLTFRLADRDEAVLVNAIRHPGGFAFAYRPAAPGPRARHLDRVGHLLCRALERAPHPGPLPEAPMPPRKRAAERVREPLGIYLPGGCDRSCVFCSVSVQRARGGALPVVADARLEAARHSVEARLREQAADPDAVAVEWSGKDCLASPLFDDALSLAKALGYRGMGIQTPGTRLAEPGFATWLAEQGVDHAALTAHAADPTTFDAVGGKEGAHRLFWTGVDALREAGIRVALEVPCVRATLAGLARHVADLVERLGERTPITVFFWYPSADMAHTYRERGVDFDAALAALEELKTQVAARRVAINGIPECAAPPALRAHFFWSYGRQHMSFVDFERVAACAECDANERCPGIVPSYARTWPLALRPLSAAAPAPPA